jgi:hypothetical protein
MKYRVFNTESEAIAAETVISEKMGYTKHDAISNALTTCWAIPRQILDGRWVFPSPDDAGVEYDETWFSPVELT